MGSIYDFAHNVYHQDVVYPVKISERLKNLQQRSPASGGNAVGAEANFACGSFVRFWVLIDAENGCVESVNFASNGCGFMVAAADVLASMVVKRKLADLHGLALADLRDLLHVDFGELPISRVGCAEAAINALRTAFSDYRSRQLEEFCGEKALICTCFGVTEETIESLINERSLTSADDVTRLSNAGSGCGSCRMLIQEIVDSRDVT